MITLLYNKLLLLFYQSNIHFSFKFALVYTRMCFNYILSIEVYKYKLFYFNYFLILSLINYFNYIFQLCK
jgi:hypothetical protein